MMYRRMCICDVEPVYLRRLAAYLNRHPGFLWRIRTSANLGGCLREVPEVLIVSGAALAEYDRAGGHEKPLEDAGCRIILLEDDSGYQGSWPSINKYQSAKRFYEDLLEILGGAGSGSAEIIGVYGPSSGPEAEAFAVRTAKERIKKGEVLLISFAEFSTFPTGNSEQNGLGEWFYYQMQRQEEGKRISDWVYSEGDMDYLKGFRTVYDRMEVKLPAWNSFYVNTLRKSRYGTVILVFDRLPEYMELFTWCDRLYVQWGQDGFGDFRKQEFKKMTVYMGMDELMDKMTEE
ncbi:hypothetical protein [Frisingicoccus sp.]|uniref:hypothetical protein n=1 Tax=Frisingicoccus sp. TaxID=1918627 RepID=UPI003AB486E0